MLDAEQAVVGVLQIEEVNANAHGNNEQRNNARGMYGR